jgi:histidine kinase/DNA gyrase B/HSP90-like ATPase
MMVVETVRTTSTPLVQGRCLTVQLDRKLYLWVICFGVLLWTFRLGLGLYVCRQIMELHGGRIEAEFPPRGGTRFVLILPYKA